MPNKTKENRLRTAFFLNFFFSILEIIGGLFTNSVALLSDAVHDIGDSISLGLSWFLNEKSKKKPDEKYTYGYARYSLLGGLISAIVLIIGSTLLIIESIPRIMNPVEINVPWLIAFAIVGIAINGYAAFRTSKGHSINERMVSLHLFEDVFGWIVLLISSIVMAIWDFPILDPLISIAFTLYIMTHVYKNLKLIVEIFLEKAPKGIDIEAIRNQLLTHPLIDDIHHIHIWTLEGNLVLMTFHALMNADSSKETIIETQSWIHEVLEESGIHHSTVELECGGICYGEECDPISETEPENQHHHH